MSNPDIFPGKLAIQQRVLTPYRAAFFDALAEACQGGLSICAGLPRPEESITVTDVLDTAQFTPVKNVHILKNAFYFCHQRGLMEWLKKKDPDVLILEANPRYLATPAALRWMKAQNRPLIGWGLGAPAITGALAELRKERRRAFLHQFDVLLTYSRRGADEYAALGIPEDKIFVAPNAAAHHPTMLLPDRKPSFGDRPVLLFVGRLQARKRVDLLLRACASLPETLQPRLVIVGDGPERTALELLAKSVYPIAEFPGAKHGAELAPYFSAADLFVLPGTGGLAVQEAMSYGLPIIMGKGDGTNDDLVRSANGWQIPDNNPDALANTIQVALSDVRRLRMMGAESYRIGSEEINLEKMVGVFVNAINSLRK